MGKYDDQLAKFRTQAGFIAALDQSGGSTPKALKLYGVPETAWSSEAGMMDLVHAMRARIVTSPSFNGNRILAAILFENTMDRDIEGRPTAEYLWEVKKVVPILKVDKGLADEADISTRHLSFMETGRSVPSREMVLRLTERLDVPLIVDAGLGLPSHACQVMEWGYDAVLLNTAVALAQDPLMMAGAFADAVQAGRGAYRGGVMAEQQAAQPSTPVLGTPFWHHANS